MKRLSKLGLLALPFMLVGCGGGKTEFHAKVTWDFVNNYAKCGNETDFSHVISFTFLSTDDSTKKVKKDIFTAKSSNGTEFKAKHLVSRPYGSLYDLKSDIYEEVTIPGENGALTYVAFDYSLTLSSAKYYINNVEIPTDNFAKVKI